jgi:hypothetical protein
VQLNSIQLQEQVNARMHYSAHTTVWLQLPSGVLCLLLLLLQVVSTVATLSKTTSTLSKDARNKMVDVGKAGIAAAKLSHKPLTPEAGSRLIAVLAAGKGISATCKLATALSSGCKAPTAPVPAATRHLLEVSLALISWWQAGARGPQKVPLGGCVSQHVDSKIVPSAFAVLCLLSMACITSWSADTLHYTQWFVLSSTAVPGTCRRDNWCGRLSY